MIRNKAGKFYIVVNPFINSFTTTMYDSATQCTYIRDLGWKEWDEWQELELAGKLYDIHVIYDSDFQIYITEAEEGVPMGCGRSREVQIEVQLHDGGPTTKLQRKKW